ncbi:MAG: insulinase family protein [Parachlamydiaceae bacterium]|nr:insulinase family protein [Parachlamydiaceae bacterium]
MLRSLILLALVYSTVVFGDYQVIEDLAKVPILSPTFGERQKLKLKLSNGLEVYLASDPQGSQSSAALVVKAGSWQDPPAYPGIAHFLEHMLFLGTKKYPNESEFDGFVAEHDGQTNAFTSTDFTAYAFSIDSDAFGAALDRFSQFFIAPIFNPSGVARELHAIDQEYAKNIENDDMREYYVYKELSNPEHPNHAFSMGNKETLAKVSQATLKQWYQEHYSANCMRLVVNSSLPLNELVKMVTEDFVAIPNYNLPPLHIDAEMIPAEIKGHMVYIEPITHMRKVTLIWSLPAKFGAMQETKPYLLVCQMLNNEGKGSLLTDLKRDRLAEGIECRGYKIGPDSFEFAIEIELTDLGVKDVYKVISKCFQAIASFKQKGVPQYLFDELHKLTTLSYQYQERKNVFDSILKEAEWSAEEELSTYPENSQMIKKFDSKAVNDLLNYLTPETCLYSLIAPEVLTKVPVDRQEQWLKVHYAIKAIPAETLRNWSLTTTNSNFELPAINLFLPEKLNLVSQKNLKLLLEQIPKPEVLYDNEMAKIYFSKDLRYLVPKISWIFEIKTPAIDVAKPDTVVLGDLYVKHIMETLSDYSFSANQAGLDFKIERRNNGLSITIEGYNDKARRLCLEIIKALKEPQIREQKFKNFKSSLIKQYQNTSLENPLLQGYEVLKSIIYREYATDKSKLLAIRKITFDQFDQFTRSVLDSAYIEGMLYGNMSKQEAKDLVLQMLSMLESKVYLKKEQPKDAIIVLPANTGPYYLESKITTQGNVAILSVELLPYNFQTRAAQQVLMQSMKDPFYVELRTRQQTGYIVISQPDEFDLHLFNSFMVQSNSHEGRDLIARFELFIENFLQEIESSISKERFEKIKEALLKTLRQPPKNISEMGNILHKLAFKYEGDFNWIEKRIKGLEDLSYEGFVDLAIKMLGKQNKRRLAISLSGVVPINNVIQYQKIGSIPQLRKLATYESAVVP